MPNAADAQAAADTAGAREGRQEAGRPDLSRPGSAPATAQAGEGRSSGIEHPRTPAPGGAAHGYKGGDPAAAAHTAALDDASESSEAGAEASSSIQALITAIEDAAGINVEDRLIPALHDGWYRGMRPVRALLAAEILDEEIVNKLLTQKTGFMAVEPMGITREAADMLPQWLCEQHGVVPVSFDGKVLTVVSVENLRPLVQSAISEFARCAVNYRLTSNEALTACIVALPGRRSDSDSGSSEDEKLEAVNESVANWHSLVQSEEGDTEIPRLVEALITRAVALDASDIHIQTELDDKGNSVVTASLRRLGDLVPHDVYSVANGYKIINRLKVAGGFDVDPTKPCDGRYDITIPGSGRYDLRLAGMPLAQGQMLVLRMLPQMRKGKKTLEDLFPLEYSDLAPRIQNIAAQPEGMLLIVGSTGSGKSTTLAAMIRPLAKNTAIKVVTVEDPVENLIKGAQQVAVTPRLSFGDALRGFLRSDPDAILLGEIRDQDTAAMAIRAAQTGHIVFSTLHASTVEMTPGRLAEMGVPRASLADVLLGVISQRLVKTLCVNCSSGLPGGRREAKLRGCDGCAKTGWGGRMAIVEFMEVNSEVASLIADGSPAHEVRAAARVEPYSQFAARLIDSGITTREAITAKLGDLYDPSYETSSEDSEDYEDYSMDDMYRYRIGEYDYGADLGESDQNGDEPGELTGQVHEAAALDA